MIIKKNVESRLQISEKSKDPKTLLNESRELIKISLEKKEKKELGKSKEDTNIFKSPKETEIRRSRGPKEVNGQRSSLSKTSEDTDTIKIGKKNKSKSKSPRKSKELDRKKRNLSEAVPIQNRNSKPAKHRTTGTSDRLIEEIKTLNSRRRKLEKSTSFSGEDSIKPDETTIQPNKSNEI